MGTPVPTPPLYYGNDCVACDIWEPGETPLNVYVYFSGLGRCVWGVPPEPCLVPPNGNTFKLTQMPASPCVWRHLGSVWDVYWYACNAPGGSSRVLLQQPDRARHFEAYGPNCPEELHIYHNENPFCGAGNCSVGGLAVVHWMGIVLGIVVGMSLPSSTIMHELFVKDDTSQIVHKFCFPLYGMNVKMLMSP